MKSPLKWLRRNRRQNRPRYWWDRPDWEIQLDKQLKQRKNKFKGGHLLPLDRESVQESIRD